MQNIKPLLVSASPLGVIKNFDISNRLLLRKSNFELGLTNYIQPLGTRLLGKSPLAKPLAEYPSLVPSQEQPVIDEGWDFDAFAFSTNELEADISLRQEEKTTFHHNSFNNDFIDNHTTTIITDLLPNTTQNNFDNHQDGIFSTNTATNNITNANKSNIQQGKASKKTNSKSKDTSKTKSITKKSSTGKKQKQSQKKVSSNPASETHQILPDDNELPLNSPILKNPLEANNLLSKIKNPANTDIAVKGIPNQQTIRNPNINTIFPEIQESDNVVQADIVENTQSESHSIDLGTFVNQSIDNLSTYQNNSTIIEELNNQENIVNTQLIPEATTQPIVQRTPNLIVEGLNQQENLVNTQLIPEATTQPIVQRTPNLIVEGLNQQENLVNTQFIPEVTTQLIVQRTPNLTVQDTGQDTKIYSDEQIISFTDSTQVANNNISETAINNILGEQNINLEPAIAKTNLSPIIQRVIIDDITQNKPPIIQNNTQENNLEIVSEIIYPVLEPDSIIAKSTQDDLQVSYPLQSVNNYPENAILTDSINNQQIEPTKILSNQGIFTDAEISDTAVNQKGSQPKNNVDNAKFDLQVNNISSNFPGQINTSELNDSTPIEIRNLESNENSVNQKQISAEILSPEISGIVNKSSETQTVENIETIIDSTEVSPKNHFDNLPEHLQEKLPAPVGYAIGGLVASSNIVNVPDIASSDTIPAMLTPGEFVINTRDAQKNINVLRHINSGGTLPEDITTPVTPNIESIEETNTNFLQPSTLVDNFQTSPHIISPKRTNSSILSRYTSEITSPGITTDNPLQFNTFQNSRENSTGITENQSNYSSPPLIFRQVANNNTTKTNNLNTSAPSQWNTVEELLNGSVDESTIFNYSSDSTESINYSSKSNYTNLQTPQILTKRLPVIQGFADGGEVTESDIATDIKPITETIQIPVDSDNSNNEEKNKNDSPDLETLAREIYARLRQRLEIERERYGMFSGRLPW
jgi:hypothetical protein